MSDTTDALATLIHNERTKLLANALDRASTTFGVGSLFPLYSLSHPAGGVFEGLTQQEYAFSVALFVFVAIVIHLMARHLLGGLR